MCATAVLYLRTALFYSVLTLDGIIAHDIIPGSVTSDLFVRFLREHVVCFSLPSVQLFLQLPVWYYHYQIPLTNPYPGPRSVLVMDNCNIHHSEDVRELVEDEAG